MGLNKTEEDHKKHELSAKRRKMSEKAYDIESQSFEIIEEEVGKHPYNTLEWYIVRRAIHSTADFDFAGSHGIVFGHNVFASVFKAIENKCSIVTDVEMV
jgi:precorrin-8X/cobalt-precorrin-8 methylmutase